MRLFLLPISTRRTLIYCQRLNTQLSSETTYIDKITTRASNTWLKWEKAEKGWRTGWQKKVTQYGNKLFETIPHEEWGLKAIPPLSKRRKDEELVGKKQVEVVYPSSVITEDRVKQALQDFAGEQRQGVHTKWMWGSIIGMPFTIPAALVPMYGHYRIRSWSSAQRLTNRSVPNIPFFYLVFRAWSHWRARSGSRHVDFLLDNRLLNFRKSLPLLRVYNMASLDIGMKQCDSMLEEIKTYKTTGKFDNIKTNVTTEPNARTDVEEMLLSPSDGKIISELVEAPELEEHIQRAVKQVEKALKAEKELQEEKQDLESANEKPGPKR
ncbi:MAG: hypothetical protein Q9168_005753 [Polycauliona sp. 1 TL-2023]